MNGIIPRLPLGNHSPGVVWGGAPSNQRFPKNLPLQPEGLD
jgi:hypothetical protein